MSILIRLVIATVVAVVVSGFYQGYVSDTVFRFDLVTTISFLLATVITLLLAGLLDKAASGGSGIALPAVGKKSSQNREQGTVKWFNVSKGFGFITRDNGEDIFVHYRAIRGEGRRRLFDGQQVAFEVIDSDKGLQADDVEVLG